MPKSAFAQTSGQIDVPLIDARLNRLMQERGMVGMSVAIIENGELVLLKGYGQQVVGQPEKVTADTIFRWASLSKSVASIMVAKLDETDQLDLGAPAARYSRSLRLPERGERKASVADVLSHQLGIVRNAYDNRLESGQMPQTIRASLSNLPVQCEVGTCHGYQNVAFDASAEMIERVTGKSYQQTISDELFRPLGMRSMIMDAPSLVASPNWAKPHNSAGYNVFRRIEEAYFNVPAAGGLSGSIRDLASWMRAQMGLRRDVISNEVLQIVQNPRVDTPREQSRTARFFPIMDEAEYGLGWRIYDYAGRKVVGHRGAVDGYRGMILFDPDLMTGVAALWNSGSNQPVGLQLEVMDMAYNLPRHDWMYLDQGPNLNAVRRLASNIEKGQYQTRNGLRGYKNIPVPRLSPSKSMAAASSNLFAAEGAFVRRVNREPVPQISQSQTQQASFRFAPVK